MVHRKCAQAVRSKFTEARWIRENRDRATRLELDRANHSFPDSREVFIFSTIAQRLEELKTLFLRTSWMALITCFLPLLIGLSASVFGKEIWIKGAGVGAAYPLVQQW
jgi:hypothetical protein